MVSSGFTATAVLVLAVACMGQDTRSIDPRAAAAFIGSVLGEADASGSLAYWGTCGSNGQSNDFPKLRASRNRGASTLQILREAFADSPKMRVVQRPDGTIRMFETDVPKDLLDLKIRHISFTTSPDRISSPSQALLLILLSPEVNIFMKTHNIGPSSDSYGFSFLTRPNSPSISGDLNNVTVSQALDYILQTYPGYWMYENCPSDNGGRTVLLNFFPRVPAARAALRDK